MNNIDRDVFHLIVKKKRGVILVRPKIIFLLVLYHGYSLFVSGYHHGCVVLCHWRRTGSPVSIQVDCFAVGCF